MIKEIEFSNINGFHQGIIRFENNKGVSIIAQSIYSRKKTIEEICENEQTHKELLSIINQKPLTGNDSIIRNAQKAISAYNSSFSHFINKVNFDIDRIIDKVYDSNTNELRNEEYWKKFILPKTTEIKYSVIIKTIY